MSATLATTCPNCSKQFQVPAQFVGKLIRCKNCQATFEVQGPSAPKAARPAKPAAPVAAKPAGPPVAAKAAPPPAADPHAPIPFKDEPPAPPHAEEDEGKSANPYGVIKESDVPRCPFCALELDPPDTRVCLNCGYNLLERMRHKSRKVYETTAGDYFLHWLPAIAFIILIIGLVVVNAICWLNMYSWLTDSFLDQGEKNEITGKPKFYLEPWCFSLWISIFSAFFVFKMTKFTVKRLVFNWRPEEVEKRSV